MQVVVASFPQPTITPQTFQPSGTPPKLGHSCPQLPFLPLRKPRVEPKRPPRTTKRPPKATTQPPRRINCTFSPLSSSRQAVAARLQSPAFQPSSLRPPADENPFVSAAQVRTKPWDDTNEAPPSAPRDNNFSLLTLTLTVIVIPSTSQTAAVATAAAAAAESKRQWWW